MFNSVISTALTLSSFLICLFGALVLGVLTALVFSFRSRSSSSLTVALALLPPIVTLVIMMVNGSIGAGLAVAGTFSLVRFRSAPGTAKEICGVFMATAIGLACGMGYVGVAALFFLVMGLFVVAMNLLRLGEASNSYRHLKIAIPETLNYEDLFEDLFDQYTSRHELTRVKTTNMGTLYELNYDIFLKDKEVKKDFIDAIRCRNGNLNIVCSRRNESEQL
ncbi:MAG: DUF4956 domain-containing protein [Oscillospiraceae bacterium]|nr:DUF4956 domain-containing protein [Oscillospiraceae bacterium]